MDNEYSTGFDDGKDYGFNVGYESGYDDGRSETLGTFNDLLEEQKDSIEKEVEDRMEREFETVRYNFQTALEKMNSEIIELKRTIYDLRKEHATTSKTISTNTKLRN